LINAEFAQENRAEMDPNIVLTNCLLNTYISIHNFASDLSLLTYVHSAFIVLFKRLAPYPEGVTRDYDHISDTNSHRFY
jgi:hypothetical protein